MTESNEDRLAEALLPCPFCGSTPAFETTTSPDAGCHCVECPDCNFSLMSGPVGIGWFSSKAKAAAAWNLRAAHESKDEVSDAEVEAALEGWFGCANHPQSGALWPKDSDGWKRNMRAAIVAARKAGVDKRER